MANSQDVEWYTSFGFALSVLSLVLVTYLVIKINYSRHASKYTKNKFTMLPYYYGMAALGFFCLFDIVQFSIEARVTSARLWFLSTVSVFQILFIFIMIWI